MTYKIKPINISKIYLDNENPRHDPIESEPEIIAHLLAEEAVKPLARHISEIGSISPLERVAVMEHPKVKGAYVSVEGNRRICALKLLADPDKANSEANKKYFWRLAANMENPPKILDAVIFSDRKASKPWVSLRHEGEQGGVGTKAWNADQKARFNASGKKGGNPDVQSFLLKNYALSKKLLTPEQIENVSITTLTRYLSNPVFRAAMGLADNKTLTVDVATEEFDQVTKQFLTDTLNPKTGVNSRTNVAARRSYAEKLRTEGVAPTTRNLPPVDLSVDPRPSNSKGETKRRNNRSPDKRKNVVPRTFTVHIKDKILKRLYDELRKIEAEEFTFAAVYLLRAVLEQAVTLYLRQEGQPIDKELHKKLGRVAIKLAAEGMSDRELKMLRTMAADKESRYSPDTLGHFVHGGAVPTATQAIRLWDSIEPALNAIFSRLK